MKIKVAREYEFERCYHMCPYFELDGGPSPAMLCTHPKASSPYIISHPDCDVGFPKDCPLILQKLKEEDVGFDPGGNRPRLYVGDVFEVTEELVDKMKQIFMFGDTLPLGEYVVVEAKKDGGGYGHGLNDVYPDGWHVFARQLKNGEYDAQSKLYSFFQTGCFHRKIEEVIFPVRKMRINSTEDQSRKIYTKVSPLVEDPNVENKVKEEHEQWT